MDAMLNDGVQDVACVKIHECVLCEILMSYFRKSIGTNIYSMLMATIYAPLINIFIGQCFAREILNHSGQSDGLTKQDANFVFFDNSPFFQGQIAAFYSFFFWE